MTTTDGFIYSSLQTKLFPGNWAIPLLWFLEINLAGQVPSLFQNSMNALNTNRTACDIREMCWQGNQITPYM